jgi:hypothetical protein
MKWLSHSSAARPALERANGWITACAAVRFRPRADYPKHACSALTWIDIITSVLSDELTPLSLTAYYRFEHTRRV